VRPFGEAPDGQPVGLYTLCNATGASTTITNYGGIVVSLEVPDRSGALRDVVLGHDSLAGYVTDNTYFGALIGRHANRIARGRFSLGDRTHVLATNDGPNHLHGGLRGFDRVVWSAKPRMTADGPALELVHASRDGEEGYPGNLTATAVYTLTNDQALRLELTATTDRETVVNLTHHSYFNLADSGASDVLGHEVMLNAKRFTPVDSTLIPTGQLRPVRGTPFDFTRPTAIGRHIDDSDEQLAHGNGYDHNWVLDKAPGHLGLAARVYEPTSGLTMEVLATAPGLQFYSGNYLNDSHTGKGGTVYAFRHGFCMEPQHFPDSPNQPDFPGAVLLPGDVYRSVMIYRFSTRN